MRLDKKVDIMDLDLPDIPPITKEDRERIIKDPNNYWLGTRIALGLFQTDEEYEKWRKQIPSKPLP